MQKGIFLESDVNEGRVEARHQFLDLSQVEIAYRESVFALLIVKLNELFIFE